MIPKHITKEYLNTNPNHIFVFGDNTKRRGTGGAAILRYHPQTYGFITKKEPHHYDSAYYKPDEYKQVFEREVINFLQFVKSNPDKKYLISLLGAGLANKFKIFEEIIEPNIKKLIVPSDTIIYLW